MKKYNLQPNESIIIKSEKVLHGVVMAKFTDELILTNLNLVFVSKGVFGNTKNIQIYPVRDIKVFDNQAQVKLGKHRNSWPQVEVYFLRGQEAFAFEKKKEAIKWIDSINKLLTGSSAKIEQNKLMSIPGTEFIAETLKGTIDTFKGTLGISSKKFKKEVEPKKIAKKCVSCRAPIAGIKGSVVTCKYCDTEQIL